MDDQLAPGADSYAYSTAKGLRERSVTPTSRAFEDERGAFLLSSREIRTELAPDAESLALRRSTYKTADDFVGCYGSSLEVKA
jgi:hypothetical protein